MKNLFLAALLLCAGVASAQQYNQTFLNQATGLEIVVGFRNVAKVFPATDTSAAILLGTPIRTIITPADVATVIDSSHGNLVAFRECYVFNGDTTLRTIGVSLSNVWEVRPALASRCYIRSEKWNVEMLIDSTFDYVSGILCTAVAGSGGGGGASVNIYNSNGEIPDGTERIVLLGAGGALNVRYSSINDALNIVDGASGFAYLTGPNGNNYIYLDDEYAEMAASGNQFIMYTDSTAVSARISYDSDLSAGFTDNTLVTKKWVQDNTGDGIYGGSGTVPDEMVATFPADGTFLANNGGNQGGVLFNKYATTNGVLTPEDGSLSLYTGTSAGNRSWVSMRGSTRDLTLGRKAGADVAYLQLEPGGSIFSDNTEGAGGLKYAADYAAAFTARSLVDKDYVDDAVAGSAYNLVAQAGVTLVSGTADTVYLGSPHTNGGGVPTNIQSWRTLAYGFDAAGYGAQVFNDQVNYYVWQSLAAGSTAGLADAVDGNEDIDASLSSIKQYYNSIDLEANTGAGRVGQLGVYENGVSLRHYTSSATNFGSVFARDSLVEIKADGAVRDNNIFVRPDSTSVTDRISYASDLSSTFTANTLVTKKYVDRPPTNRITSTSSPQTLSNAINSNLIDQAGTQASFTFNLPATPEPDQIAEITFTNAVTTLTISGNGTTIIGATPTTAVAGSYFKWKYFEAAAAWVKQY